jgi:hypothetical protein
MNDQSSQESSVHLVTIPAALQRKQNADKRVTHKPRQTIYKKLADRYDFPVDLDLEGGFNRGELDARSIASAQPNTTLTTEAQVPEEDLWDGRNDFPESVIVAVDNGIASLFASPVRTQVTPVSHPISPVSHHIALAQIRNNKLKETASQTDVEAMFDSHPFFTVLPDTMSLPPINQAKPTQSIKDDNEVKVSKVSPRQASVERSTKKLQVGKPFGTPEKKETKTMNFKFVKTSPGAASVYTLERSSRKKPIQPVSSVDRLFVYHKEDPEHVLAQERWEHSHFTVRNWLLQTPLENLLADPDDVPPSQSDT